MRIHVAGGWLALCLALCVQCMPVSAQDVLTDPDFAGMYGPDLGGNLLAHDAVRGWTYLSINAYSGEPALINGVPGARLVRVNNAGVPDLGWRVDASLQPIAVIVLDDGEPLLLDSNYEWQRLRPGSDGVLRPQFLPRPWDDFVLRAQSGRVARDAARNFYLSYIRYTMDGSQATLRRISATGVVDKDWRIELTGARGTAPMFTVAPDGSVFYVAGSEATFYPVPGEPALTPRSLVRVATDGTRWSQPLTGFPSALATDAQGRVYLLGDALEMGGQRSGLLRVDASGAVDGAWTASAAGASAIAAPNYGALCVVDDTLVAATFPPYPASGIRVTRRSLVDGAEIAATALPGGGAIVASCADAQVATWAQQTVSVVSARNGAFTTRQIAAAAGTTPQITSMVRQDQYYLIGGRFEYWFEGVRYNNLMRLGANLQPDATWRPVIAQAVNQIAVDAAGGVLVALDGEWRTRKGGGVLRIDRTGRKDAAWNSVFDAPVLTLTVASNGEVYAGGAFQSIDGVARPGLARFRANGQFDAAWSPDLPWRSSFYNRDAGVIRIVVSNDNDVLVSWQDLDGFMGDRSGSGRISRGTGARLPLPATLQSAWLPGMLADTTEGGVFVTRSLNVSPWIELVRIDGASYELDPTWTTRDFRGSPVAADSQYLYMADGSRLRRAAGGAYRDGRWAPSGASYVDRVATGTAGVGFARRETGPPLLVRAPAAGIEAVTVVEYFARDAQRFFMTARGNEQAALDAMPGAFVRTGMQLQVFDGRIVPPAPGVVESGQVSVTASAVGALPVCRYFAPRERGGSGTHFYGQGAECALLNTLPGFVHEGHDFSAHPRRSASCQSATPVPVYRLYNGRSAQNDGNHRYVVSQSRRIEMLGLGWVDEGVAFCVAAATDSRPFAAW